ncbi:MAG: dynamin family protein [Thermodesulfobacteriota bacterium]
MYRENYINSLRAEMVDLVSNYLSPVALKYGYSDVSLETTIKWRPMVLILGNYSSGKSTLINEFLGADIQAVGQAPTDDSFTIITYDEQAPDETETRITEVRDGKYLLNDPDYPFEILKKHGQRFASHFRLKRVNSPFLRNLALIDTPGMLDSITERDRGYNYQDVIGDMAQLADLVLVLFDPHKAGTVREAHTSVRETIATRTYEDRVLFVLNRIDECASLSDLLQVYGTLCWNLSQITGRKDIPPIHLTYSSRSAKNAETITHSDAQSFLYHLQNQRKKLKEAVLEAPQRRLDNLASFIETHSERMDLFLEGLIAYRLRMRKFRFKVWLIGLLVGAGAGAAAMFGEIAAGIFGGIEHPLVLASGAAVVVLVLIVYGLLPVRYFNRRFLKNQLKHLNHLISLETQTRKDNWQAVRELVAKYLQKSNGKFSLGLVRQDYQTVHRVYTHGTREVRKALNELTDIMADQDVMEDMASPIDTRDPDHPPSLSETQDSETPGTTNDRSAQK